MTYSNLIFEHENAIGVLTINRPDAFNALNSEVFFELLTFFEQIEKIDLRALIITGAGKAFIAGADIKAFQTLNSAQAYEFSELGKKVFDTIARLDIPVIAAINGFALGGGLELAMACDIRLAHEKAKLGLPEVNLGLVPGFNGTQRLTRLVGLGNALYIMMLGEGIPAQEAYSLGLVQSVSAEDVLADAKILASKISKKSPNAIRVVKELAHKGLEMSMKDAAKYESKEFGFMFKEDQKERIEGVNAFVEKRKPNW